MDPNLKVALVAGVTAWLVGKIGAAAGIVAVRASEPKAVRRLAGVLSSVGALAWLLAWGVCLVALIRWALTP